MRVLGMISGTSHDGIDVAVVDLRLEGATLVGRLLHGDSVPYAPDLREHLVRTLPPAQLRYQDVCQLDTRIGQAFAQVAADAIAAAGPVDLVCSHGQTVFLNAWGGGRYDSLLIADKLMRWGTRAQLSMSGSSVNRNSSQQPSYERIVSCDPYLVANAGLYQPSGRCRSWLYCADSACPC